MRRPLGALATLQAVTTTLRLLRSLRAGNARTTLGTIRPPLTLRPLAALGSPARMRLGLGRGRRLGYRGRGRNGRRLRPAPGVPLARTTFMARLARMVVATDRPPNLDELVDRRFGLGHDLRQGLSHRNVRCGSFRWSGDGKGGRFCDAAHQLRHLGEDRRA